MSNDESKPTLSAEDVRTLIMESLQHTLGTTGTKKLEMYSATAGQDLLRWLEDFEYISNSNKWSDEAKIVKLPTYLSGAAREWYSVKINDKIKNWDEVLDSMKKQFLPVDQETWLRQELSRRIQKINEPVANYIVAKEALCNRIDPKMKESEKGHHVMIGLNPKIGSSLFAHNPKDLNELTEKAKLIERGLESCLGYKEDEKELNGKDIAAIMSNVMQDVMTKVVEKSENKLVQMMKEADNRNNTRNFQGNPVCWVCGKPGHKANQCDFSRRNKPNNFQRNNNGPPNNRYQNEQNN